MLVMLSPVMLGLLIFSSLAFAADCEDYGEGTGLTGILFLLASQIS